MTTDTVAGELVLTGYIAPVDKIRVIDRHRKDLGDVSELARSITEIGLVHPIVVTPDMRLVAGQRRLEAFRHLGRVDIPVRVLDDLNTAERLLQAEQEENTCRKDFTPTEAQALHESRMELLKPLFDARKEATQAKPGQQVGSHLGSGQLPEPKDEPRERYDERREVAAAGLGFSEASMRRVREVKAIADDESAPDELRQLAREALAEMDETGKVHAPWQRARAAYKEWKATVPAPEKPNPDPSLPASKRKDADAVAERRARLAEMAERGHSSEQIAAELGYSTDKVVRKIAKELGVEIPADKALGRTRRKIDHHRIVASTVADLEGTRMSLELLDVTQIEDLSEIDYWVTSLGKSATALRKLARQLSDHALNQGSDPA